MADVQYADREWPRRAKTSMFKGDMTPAPVVRKAKKASQAALLQQAYDAVDARDKEFCQVTGKKLRADHVDEWQRLTRDHLAPRGSSPERRHDPDNILTCSAGIHSLIQKCWLIPVDKNGIDTTHVSQIAGYIWNRERVKKAPLRLGRKEWKPVVK